MLVLGGQGAREKMFAEAAGGWATIGAAAALPQAGLTAVKE
jgi:hypothetical protein